MRPLDHMLTTHVLITAVAGGAAPAAGAQVRINEWELARTRAEADRAADLLADAWQGLLPSGGRPRVIAYRDSQPTACGMLGPENAFYCVHDDAIYYDEWFLAAVRGMVAQELGTEGSSAVFAILGHEWGHRVHEQLRPEAGGIPRFAELTADCLGGAAFRETGRRAAAMPTDTAEATLTLRLLGDEPDPRSSHTRDRRATRPPPGDPAARGRAQRGLTRHGDPDERARHFERGLRQGAGKCMKELQEGG